MRQEPRLRHRYSPHSPDTVTQNLTGHPERVFSAGTIWLVYFPFRSSGEAVLYGRVAADTFRLDGMLQAFDVFDSVT